MTSRVFCAVVVTMTMSTCFCRKSRARLTLWCWPPPSPRSRASCFTTCLCLELVGETVCSWSARRTRTIRKTDDITCVLRSCDDDDNEHVLLSKIARLTAWCWPPSSPRSRASVLRLVCVWSWLGRQCVPGPRAVQSVRLQLPRHLVCAWPTLHGGSLDSPSSCTSLPAVNPLIHRLKQDTTKQIWFADDATAGGKLNNLREWWDCLTNIGPEYGYFPNDQKHGSF